MVSQTEGKEETGELRVLTVNPNEPRQERLTPAVDALQRGRVVALPTETFYGLAVDCFDPEALLRLKRLKQKADSSAALLLLADAEQVGQVAASLPASFESLAAMFWPGPLTLVVPASSKLPSEVSGGRGTVAVRVPGLAVPRRLAARLGRPITGVSANLYGQPPCRTALEVAGVFSRGLSIILDGGTTAGGAPSTILDLTEDPPRLLRAGLLPVSALQAFLPGLSDSPV